MTKIGLISDTHGVLIKGIEEFIKPCDQIWHAGDWGDVSLFEKLQSICHQVIGVFGNIDGPNCHPNLPYFQSFKVENVEVLIIHIGGYPGKYTDEAKKLIKQYKPTLFITGHSHILKAIFDPKNQLLHLNPGAAGKSGFHKIITAMRFDINNDRIENLEILELKK